MGWTSWRLAGTGTNVPKTPGCGGAGCPEQDWQNPGNITAKDDTPATNVVGKDYPSHYIMGSDFGFSAEVGATDIIYAVGMRIKIKCDTYPDDVWVEHVEVGTSLTAPSYYNDDHSVNMADGYDVQEVYEELVYEDVALDWFPVAGAELTAADVRASTFSAWFAVNQYYSADRYVRVDSVEMRVYTIPPSSLHLMDTSSIGTLSSLMTFAWRSHMKTSSITVWGKAPRDIILLPNTGEAGVSAVKHSSYLRVSISSAEIRTLGNKIRWYYTTLIVSSADVGVTVHSVGRAHLGYANVGGIGVAGAKAPLPNQVKTSGVGLAGKTVFDSLGPDGSATLNDLQLIYSGGATVTDQFDSLGGVISSAVGKEVYTKYQLFTLTVYTSWIDVTAAYGNPAGTGGTFWYLTSPNRLEWTPHGYHWSEVVTTPFTVPGDYVVGDDEHGYVEVTILSQPPGDDGVALPVQDARHRMFDPVNPYEAYHGKTDYRCFYLKNTASNRAYGVSLWVEEQPPVGTYYELGVGSAPTGDGATTGVEQTIATEHDAPIGVTFSLAPIDSPISLGSVGIGQARAIWVKRTVLPEVKELIFFNPIKIGMAAFI